MGDYSSFAAVTRALVLRLQQVLSGTGGPVQGALVLPHAPQPADKQAMPCVTVFLYHIAPNAAFRNADLATRASDGAVIRRPRAAFDLFFMFSFFGADSMNRPETQLMWGMTAAEFHANPFVTLDEILSAQAGLKLGPEAQEAARRDAGPIRIVPHVLDTDTMARLWHSFPQVPYTPSMVFKVGPVFVGLDDWPALPLPVLTPQTDAAPDVHPPVPPADAGTLPLPHGADLPVPDLPSGQSHVWLEGHRLTVRHNAGGAAFIHLGGAGLPIGPWVPLRLTSDRHGAVLARLDIRPKIQSLSVADGRVTVRFAPDVPPDSLGRLLLNDLRTGQGHALSGQVVGTPGKPGDSVAVDLTGVPPGRYLTRLSLPATDGSGLASESLLDSVPGVTGSESRFTGPILTLGEAAT